MSKAELIKNMLRDGKNYPTISRELGVAGSTIAYHARRIGREKFSFDRKTYNWDQIQSLYDEGYNYTKICEQIGIERSSLRDGIQRGALIKKDDADRKLSLAKRRIQVQSEDVENIGKKNLVTSRFNGKRGRCKLDLPNIFRENSLTDRGTVRANIIKFNLIPYVCSGAECHLTGGFPLWAGKSIALHLDHINGIRNDHRLQNLRWLCPNCHSQTDTYCRRNIGSSGETCPRNPSG